MRKAKLILSARDFELTLTALGELSRVGAGTAASLRSARAKNAVASQGKRTSVRIFLTQNNAKIIACAYKEGGLKARDAVRLRAKLVAALQDAHDKTRARPGANPAATGRKQRARNVSGRANPI